MEIKTKAFIIRITPFGERDAIVDFLCDRMGRCTAIARGFFSSRRRFGFALDYFNLLDIGLKKGRSSLFTLTWAEPAQVFHGLRDSLSRSSSAMMLLHVVGKLSEDTPADSCGFNNLVQAFSVLEHSESVWDSAVSAILDYMGCYGFSLTRVPCASCGSTMEIPAGLTIHGRPLCERCCTGECRRFSKGFMQLLNGKNSLQALEITDDLEYFLSGITDRKMDLKRFLVLK